MAVRVTQPGGRRGIVSLASADVPSVSPARDPGVRVADTGIDLSPLASSMADVSDLTMRKVRRDEGIAREDASTQFRGLLQNRLRDIQATKLDMSDSAVAEAQGAEMQAEMMRLLDEHKGGQSSKAQLTNRLQQQMDSFADALAVTSISQAETKREGGISRAIAGVVQDIMQDPEVMREDTNLTGLLRFYTGALEEEFDFLELTEAERQARRPAAVAQMATSIITPLIRTGQFDRAREFLRSDELSGLDPGIQLDAETRIARAEDQREQLMSEGMKYLAAAESLNPPGTSQAKILEDARALAGLVRDNPDHEIIEIAGRVFAVNKQTGAIVNEQTLMSPEEQEEIAAGVERAKLGAKVNFLEQFLGNEGESKGLAFTTEGIVSTLTGGEPGATATAQAPQKGAGARPAAIPPGDEVKTQILSPGQALEPAMTPFGADIQATEDAQDIARLFIAAQKMFLMDEGETARGLLAQARFLADQSAALKASGELDMPISPDMAQQLNVPVGTRLRDVLGVMMPTSVEQQQKRDRAQFLNPNEAMTLGVPFGTTRGEAMDMGMRLPTPEEVAERTSRGKARGTKQVAAEEQLTFINEAETQIDDLIEEINADPTIVGAVGALRATGRSALTVLQDFGLDELVAAARDLADEDSELGIDEVEGMFDNPELSSLDIMANSIGLILARLRNPTGRLPVELIRRSIAEVGLKGARGSKVVVDRLNKVKELMGRRRASLRKRFPDMPAELFGDPPGSAGGVEGFEGFGGPAPAQEMIFRRDKQGKLKLVPSTPEGGGTTDRPFE